MLNERGALVEACKLVYNSPQTKPFIQWIESQREEVRDLLEASAQSADVLRQLQGKAQAYREILDFLHDNSKL